MKPVAANDLLRHPSISLTNPSGGGCHLIRWYGLYRGRRKTLKIMIN